MGLWSPLHGRDVLSLLLTVRLQPVPARGKRGRLRCAEPRWYLTELPVCGCQSRAGPAEPFRNLQAARCERVFILVNGNHVRTWCHLHEDLVRYSIRFSVYMEHILLLIFNQQSSPNYFKETLIYVFC